MILLIRCLQPPQQVAALQRHRHDLVTVPLEDGTVGQVAGQHFTPPGYAKKGHAQLDGTADLFVGHGVTSPKGADIITYATPPIPPRQVPLTTPTSFYPD